MNGEFRNTMDEKGRLMIPPRIREQLGTATELMLTKSMDNSLWLFTRTDFDALDAEINYGPLAMFNKNSRALDMAVIAPAREVEFDKAGRLSIPQVLREYAGLEAKTECVILGSKNHVEILSVECYEKLMEGFRSTISEAGNNLSEQRMGV
ncbi:MAG: division/cell wall cluster transcriptional repressor MraZ [Sphaerochaetaceae bacterium]|nr:division/cell wall cluster transcriptional repressor MraZ [Sphaerochaetaceae bacterium]